MDFDQVYTRLRSRFAELHTGRTEAAAPGHFNTCRQRARRSLASNTSRLIPERRSLEPAEQGPFPPHHPSLLLA